MAHRVLPEHGWRHRLLADAAFLVIAAGVFTVLFITGDLLLYGHVNW